MKPLPFDCRIIRRGTSLLEVFMVLLILTGSLSIIGVSGAFQSRTALKQDTDEVLRGLRLARETAILSGCEVSIRTTERKHPSTGLRCDAFEMSVQPSPYRDAIDAQNVSHFGATSANPNEWMAEPIWLNSNTDLKADTRTIVFRPDGLASQDTQWKLSSGSDSTSIRIEANTGNILLGSSS